MILAMKKTFWRAAIGVGFIIFLFYSNLLMGESSLLTPFDTRAF
jgi:hypothetical protein